MRALALAAALSLGGCSLFADTRHPYTTARGERRCTSYALPVIDSLVAAPALGLGGLMGYLVITDPQLDEMRPFALVLLALGVPSAIGAVVGFRDIPRCNRELRATAP